MYKFLIKTKDKKKIFIYKPYEGICEVNEKAGGMSGPRCICKEGSEVFFVYKDNEGVIHLITVDKKNRFIYMNCKDEEWHQYVICSINENMIVKKVMIGMSRIGQNLFYSAEYQQEHILVHCVLGNHAMPSTIDKMNCESFFVNRNKVYYSNADGILGCRDFSDGKPDDFVKIARGRMPYILNINNKEYIVYKNGDQIYVNAQACAKDAAAEHPIIVNNKGMLTLMWQDRDFVKYLPYEEKYFNIKPMKYISNGIKPSIYVYSNGTNCREYMGIYTNNKLKVFTDADPFLSEEECKKEDEFTKKQEEILTLKRYIDKLRKEINDYKTEIQKLNIMIHTMVKNTQSANSDKEDNKNQQ